MQRRARLQDTHEDNVDFEDFDMDDCDFRLEGTEGEFAYEGTKEETIKAYAKADIEDADIALPPESMVIPELPDLVGAEVTGNLPKEWIDESVIQQLAERKAANKAPDKKADSRPTTMERKPASLPPATVVASRNFSQKNLISVDSISLKMLKQLTKFALQLKGLRQFNEPIPQYLENKVVTLLFEEPSTRTRCSFETAVYRLGGKVVKVDDMTSSSASKGESFTDTVRVLSSYSDALVIRSKETGATEKACTVSSSGCPIISAGDGKGEHPTQALLDLVTMIEECPDLIGDNRRTTITVGFVGDLKNGRTVHSLVKLLNKIPKVKMIFVAPPALQIYACPEFGDIMSSSFNMSFKKTYDMEVGQCDFLYVTRLQKERLEVGEVDKAFWKNAEYPPPLDMELLRNIEAVPHMKIMHPLPRVDEISTDVDESDYQLYFTQAENGLYTRMALLALTIAPDQ